MGQHVSSAKLSAVLPWATTAPPCPHRSAPPPAPRSFHSFSCFRSADAADGHPKRSSSEDDIPNLKPADDSLSCCDCESQQKEMATVEQCRCDNICRCSGNFLRNISSDSGLSNPCISASSSHITDNDNKDYIEVINNDCDELNNVKSTSIDRYMSALTDRVDRATLECDECLCSDNADSKYNSLRLKSVKRSKLTTSKSCSKQLDLSADCTCCKDLKDRLKTGLKKKRWVSKFYNSKTGKTSKLASSSTRSTDSGLDVAGGTADASCVCTLYRRVEDAPAEPQPPRSPEPAPQPQQLSLGFARDRADWPRADPASCYQACRMSECISYEGSHYQEPDSPELQPVTAADTMAHLPFNITVARVQYGQLQANSNGVYGAIQNNANLHGALQALLTDESGAGGSGGENNVILLSVGPQGAPIDLSRLSAEDLPLEDCEERARVRRALEIAEGVEPPPGYRPHIQMVTRGELRSLLFQKQQQLVAQQQTQVQARIHTQVDYIHCLVPDLRAITSCSFYWGKMDRYEAERLLEGKPEGTFLLRDSAQEEYLFSVSFRKYGRSLHARIEQFNHKFSFDSHDPGVYAATTVTGLIEHYKDPACVMFFEPMLTAPLSRSHAFPLQHLCRAVIATATTYDGISELRLPQTLKSYLKEYHYRQRVRVKRFDGVDHLAHWQPPEGFRWEPEPNM